MTELDVRARAAAEGLRTTVGDTELMLTHQVLGDPRPMWRKPWAAFAGGAMTAAAALAVVFVGPFAPTTEDAITEPTTTITVEEAAPPTTATVPESVDPVVVPPGTEESSTTTTAPVATTSVADVEPPFLEILSPVDGSESEEARITFRGVTEPGASVFAGPYEATVEADGEWSIVLLLSAGENRARFVAIDAAGNETEAWVTVTLVVPETTTTTTKVPEETTTTKVDEPAEEWPAFEVHATYYENSATPPFDVYYGKGTPGTVVEFGSPYGSGRTEINGNGTFEAKVVFSEVPLGKTFTVVVETSAGHRFEFPFTRKEG